MGRTLDLQNKRRGQLEERKGKLNAFEKYLKKSEDKLQHGIPAENEVRE